MSTAITTETAKPNESTPDAEPIAPFDRLVLWMFLVFFVLFGFFIVGDLIVGLFR